VNPELPPLEWDGYCWEGEIVIPSWRGFQTRRGRYAALSSPAPSDGTVLLRFDTGDAGRAPPNEAQIAAFRWLTERESEVTSSVLQAIFAEYPDFRWEYIDAYDGEDAQWAAQLAPPLERPEQLRSVMGPYGVFILAIAKEGVAYVGFEFGCVWEEEHGLGVLTHKSRVVEVGPASTSFDGRHALRDASSE
jgi:hypothetical protein